MQRNFLQVPFIHFNFKKSMSNRAVVREMMKMKTTDVNDLIDPKVRDVRNKLLYCDYIESKQLKAGYKKNNYIKRKIESRLRKERENQAPAVSIAAKFFNKNSNASVTHCTEVHRNAFDESNKKYETSRSNDVNTKSNDKSKTQCIDSSSLPSSWMTDYEMYNDMLSENSSNMIYGTPNPDSEFTSVPCGGCGALLHCKDTSLPGYLPSELLMDKKESDLKSITCQRCHFLKLYDTCLKVKVSSSEYQELMKQLKIDKKAAIILLIDLTDFPCSIWRQLPSLIGTDRYVFVVGNKIDLLPKDSPHFLEHIKNCLEETLIQIGFTKMNIKNTSLVSAKTGYGIEDMINRIYRIWEYRSDVYVIGCTNSGKSTLFNKLLQSDFCKVGAVDLVQRATTSYWPGTTISLLKFPILRLSREKRYERMQRLLEAKAIDAIENQSREKEFRMSKNMELATLQGEIAHTFKEKKDKQELLKQLDTVDFPCINAVEKYGLDEESEEFKYGHWCYDTPGTFHPDQILDLLTNDELIKIIPNKIISPRTFCMWSGQTIFIAGLARLDITKAAKFIRCTVFASENLPITICETKFAEHVYNELIQTEAFTVPHCDSNRLKSWPALGYKDLVVEGIGKFESIADIVLSSAGWIAITGDNEDKISIRGWTPLGKGIHLRSPALLPKSVTLRGIRKIGSPAYQLGKQVYVKS